MSAATGCVDGSWSWRYAHDFSALANVVHASVNSVASAWHSTEAKVANDSLSHRSSHQHGDQVAEPHVGHLVQHRFGATLIRRAGDLAAEDVVLQERDGAGVLHRAGVELRDEQLVVLAECVRHAKVLVVEAKSLLGLGEQPLGIHEVRQRGPAEDTQCNLAVLVAVDVVPARIRTGDQRHQVGAHPRGGGERVHAVDGAHRGTVGHHLPVLRRGDRHVERGFEVGLVKAGEHPLGVGGFELRVQVHLAVDRVDESVQALAGVRVAAVGVDHDDVALGQSRSANTGRLVVAGHVEVAAVEGRAAHGVGGDVDDGVGAGECIERHGGESTGRSVRLARRRRR